MMRNNLYQNLSVSANINIVLGMLGICSLGIFLAWFVTAMQLLPLPRDPIWSALAGASWQFFTTVVVLYWWAKKRLRLPFDQLGITTKNLLQTTILGCLLYSLALIAFISCSNDPFIAQHGLRQASTEDAMTLLLSMSMIAAGTDLTTRGFILLGLARYSPLIFAIIVQNALWYLGHITEITQLTGCLTLWGAIGLTLTLGILGDIVALKTRNILGLAIAHILLNISMMVFIRNL
ncbi:MAG: CPBP family intramembrane metalloprotease [Thiobacillus sp.]|nr:CPBP family intramembrane metalloprotease [Thiobacillus sp.]